MKKEIIAMLLAGGKGTRLLSLTKKTAKPAVFFGGKYRIIDFPLSNCTNSGIDIVGVLTQYESIQLNDYIGTGSKWGYDGNRSKTVILPPRQKEEGSSWYNGTADAIYHNLDFIEEYKPQYVLILSGDHIYKMDYAKMLDYHKKLGADCTIAVINVSLSEANRFGIMNCDENMKITSFEEKPTKPQSTLASMGIYIFSYDKLKKYLEEDGKILRNEHDFGKHIIPKMLENKEKMYAYLFEGYWKDVGTIESLWQANMDLLKDNDLDIFNRQGNWKIYSEDTFSLPQYIGEKASVENSLINQGTIVYGKVKDSVIFGNSIIEEGTEILESVILPGCLIKKGSKIYKAIVESETIVEENSVINLDGKQVVLINS